MNAISKNLALAGALAMSLTLGTSALAAPPADAAIEACGGKGGCGCGKTKDGETQPDESRDCGKCGTNECACGQKPDADPPEQASNVIDLKNETCPIMGGKAKADVYTDYQGVRVHFCCPGCDKTFLEDPKKYLAKLGITDLDEYKRKHK